MPAGTNLAALWWMLGPFVSGVVPTEGTGRVSVQISSNGVSFATLKRRFTVPYCNNGCCGDGSGIVLSTYLSEGMRGDVRLCAVLALCLESCNRTR